MARTCFVVAAVMVVAVLAFGPTEAFAQRITLVNCTPSMTASLGVGTTGDRNAEGTGPGADAAATYEVPILNAWSVRADAGTVAWTFQEHDSRTDALLREERVRLGRVTISAIQRNPFRRDCGAPVRMYTGFGAGVYRYRFPVQRVTVTTGGIHGLLGMDIMPGEHYGFNWEVGIRAVNGPRRKPVFSHVLFGIQASVGVRVVF